MNENFDYKNQFDSNQPQMSPQPQMQRQYVTYIPYGFTPETYEEKREIRKIANIIGGALLIMSAAPVLVAVLQLILGFLGLWGVNAVKIFNTTAFSQYLQALLSILLFTVPYISLFKVGGFRISELISFKKPKKKDILPYFLLGIGVCYFANFAVSFAGQFFQKTGIDYEVDYGGKPQGFLGFMLTFIAIAVVPPLVEEFACRGIMLGALKKYGEGFAVVCSAILFGVMHGNFEQIPFAFLVGMVLGFITVKTGTIWISIAVHAFNNAISVLFDYLNKIFSTSFFNVFAVILFTFFMLGIIVAILILKDDNDAYKFKQHKNKSEMKQIYKWFFTAPTIIIFVVISLIESMAFFVM